MRDIHNNISVVEAIAPEVLVDDNTPAAVDLQGYESAEVAIHIGVGGITFTADNKIEFKLTHSDDDATYEAVDIDDVEGLSSVGEGGIVESLVAAHAAASITTFGYIGGKQYLKLLADFSGTHDTGTPISAVVIKGNPHQS
jgi:hypothetical protein